MKFTGTYNLDSGRQTEGVGAIRYTSISPDKITYDRDRGDETPEKCSVKVETNAHPDFYNALYAFLSVLVETLDVQPRWGEATLITEVCTAWTFSDRTNKWLQSITIKANYSPSSLLCPVKVSLGKIALETLDPAVAQLQENLFNEAHLFLFGNKSAQMQLDLGAATNEK